MEPDLDDISPTDPECIICLVAATCDAWCAWLYDHPGQSADVHAEDARRGYNGQTVARAGVHAHREEAGR